MRAMAGTALAVVLPLALVTAVPMPDATTLPGVVVTDEAAKIRAPEPARVADVLVRPGDHVVAGTPLLRLNSDRLVAERDRLRAQLSGLESQRVRGMDQNLAGAGLATGEIDRLRRQLADLDRRLERLLVRSATEGSIAFIDADGPALRQAVQGEVLLYVVQPGALRIQAMARDDQVRRLADRVGAPQAHLADHPGEVLGLRLLAETPESTRVLPSPALGDRAGGPIATDPADPEGQFALEPWYQVEFVPDGPLPRIGATATVRITHASRPALAQMVDSLRRVFVRRLEG
jgi:putative peptide zinc metalloprotease protein